MQGMVKEFSGKTLSTDLLHCYDGDTLYISRSPVESDWPVWLLLHVRNLSEATSDEEILRNGKWEVEVLAASPHAVGVRGIESALSCCGGGDEWETRVNDLPANKRQQVLAESLVEYGTAATLYSTQGNNRRELVRKARQEMTMAAGLLGFYLDRQANRIGDSGWEFLCGTFGFSKDNPEPIPNEEDPWEAYRKAQDF